MTKRRIITRADLRVCITRRVIETRADGSMLVEYQAPAGALAASRADGATTTDEGFLRTAGRLFRDGWLEYSDGETSWGEFRPAAEVDRALPSFRQLPVTVGHPDAFVTVDNAAAVAVGSTGSTVARDAELPDHVISDIMITHRAGLDAIKRGDVELSIGFRAIVVPQKGVDSHGRAYRFVQTDIVGNHVAIVERGRAGKDARLLLDTKGTHMKLADLLKITAKADLDPAAAGELVTIQIGEQSFEIPAAVAELIQKLMAAAPAEPAATAPAAPAAPVAPTAPDADPAAPAASASNPEEDPEKTGDASGKMRADFDLLTIEVAGLRADRDKRDRDEVLDLAKRAGCKFDAATLAKLKTVGDIQKAVILDRAPEHTALLIDNADDVGYVRRMFEGVIDAAFVSKAKGVGHALSLAAIADEDNDNTESDWLADEAAGESK